MLVRKSTSVLYHVSPALAQAKGAFWSFNEVYFFCKKLLQKCTCNPNDTLVGSTTFSPFVTYSKHVLRLSIGEDFRVSSQIPASSIIFINSSLLTIKLLCNRLRISWTLRLHIYLNSL